MKKQEAIRHMNRGFLITHTNFTDDEWMTIESGKIKTEEGYMHDFEEFWKYRTDESWNDGYKFYDNIVWTPLNFK